MDDDARINWGGLLRIMVFPWVAIPLILVSFVVGRQRMFVWTDSGWLARRLEWFERCD